MYTTKIFNCFPRVYARVCKPYATSASLHGLGVSTGIITMLMATIAQAFLFPSVVERGKLWHRQPVGEGGSNSKVKCTCKILLWISKTVEVITALRAGCEVNGLRCPGGSLSAVRCYPRACGWLPTCMGRSALSPCRASLYNFRPAPLMSCFEFIRNVYQAFQN